MATQTKTKFGSPVGNTWDESWLQRVNDTETELNHRVCGAKCADESVCTQPPDHENGRCRMHGGHDRIGAPKGNRNAAIHHLYSRHLQTCGTHCPRWRVCPYANDDIMKLPTAKRPTCVYEREEYDLLTRHLKAKPNAALREKLRKLDDPDGIRTEHEAARGHDPSAHTQALLHVLLGRAAGALAARPMMETATVQMGEQAYTVTKPSPPFEAFIRISRELRAHLALTKRYGNAEPTLAESLGVEASLAHRIVNGDYDPDFELWQTQRRPKRLTTEQRKQRALEEDRFWKDREAAEARRVEEAKRAQAPKAAPPAAARLR